MKVVCERWCVTKLCVKDGVCDKVVCGSCVKDCMCESYVKEGVVEETGRRQDGGGRIQNEKQEPHTKMQDMWASTHSICLGLWASEHLWGPT